MLLAPRLLSQFGAAVRVTRLLQVERQRRPPNLERAAAYHAVLRDRSRATLARLPDPRAGFFVDLLFGDLPRRPAFWWLFPVLTIGSVACLALIPVWPRALVVWVAICAANVVVQVLYKPRVKRFIPALHELPAFVGVAGSLAAMPSTQLEPERRALRDGASRLGALRPATRWLTFEPGQSNELAAMLYEYVNLLFLLDVNAFVFATESIRELRDVMRDVFAAIGHVDAAQSISASTSKATGCASTTAYSQGRRPHATRSRSSGT